MPFSSMVSCNYHEYCAICIYNSVIVSLEGTIVVQKNPTLEKHSDALPIRNLEVMKLLQGFASKGFVSDTFNWGYHYYILTDEGIKYLRDYLGLPSDIVPATLKKPATIPTARSPYKRFDGDDKRKPYNNDFKGERRPPRDGAREGYRQKQAS
jgi:small subunit ribosomal protein S10e